MFVFKVAGKNIRRVTDAQGPSNRIKKWYSPSPCASYMESGRQRIDSLAIDISSDITGCNGPCPGNPIEPGASNALHCDIETNPNCSAIIEALQACRAKAPPSGFTGKLHLMIQAIYGSKRTDYAYAGEGEITLAGQLIGHSFGSSAVLYTDDDGEYWLLRISGMETVTIQQWKPNRCGAKFDASTIESEAYRLATLVPHRDVVSLTCSGTRSNIGVPLAYGWHATVVGDIGNIVFLKSTTGSFGTLTISRRCSYVLNDSCVSRNQNETWLHYVARRFTIDFAVDVETDPFKLRARIWIPVYSIDQMGSVEFFTSGEAIEVHDAPIYCRYSAADVLEVITYSDIPEERASENEPDPIANGCVSWVAYDQTGGFRGFSFGETIEPGFTGSVTTHRKARNCIDGSVDSCEDIYNAPGGGFGEYNCFEIQNGVLCIIDNYVDVASSTHHVLVIPFSNHESFMLFIFEFAKTESGSSPWFDYTQLEGADWSRRGIRRRIYSAPRHGPLLLIDDIEGTTDGTGPDELGCYEFLRVQNTPPQTSPEDDGLGLYGQGMQQYLYGADLGVEAEKIEDRESYQYGHRNSWFSGDRMLTAHDGYADFVEDACFAGKS